MTREVNNGLVAPSDSASTWEQTAWRIGEEVAGPAADDVDRLARYPHEAVEAMKEAGFLSALLPEELGGGGASLCELVGSVRALAAHCASTALVLAMHTIEEFNLGRHGTTPELRELCKAVAADRLLIANANSEVGGGGDVSRSFCALESSSASWSLDKQCLAISYGEEADLIFATARRAPDASESDQVFIICRREDLSLEALSDWDTLGLRGTCSRGYRLRSTVRPELVFPIPFATVANDGGGQVRQLLLSAVWIGLAEAAASRAHAFVRAAARKSIGSLPPAALRLAEIAADIEDGRSLLVAQASRFAWLDENDDLENAGYTISLRNLKVTTSTMAVRIATASLGVCGISGFRRGSEYSLDRIIRDAHGGLIMVSNDRFLHDNAQLLVARKQL
jgi:acyl-CoA dehydrogenase